MSFKHWIKKTHHKQRDFSSRYKNLRWFIAILAVIGLFYCFFVYSSENRLLTSSLILAGATLFLILPRLISPILYLWMWVGSLIGEIIIFIFFTIVYYIVLFPISRFTRDRTDVGWQKKDTFGDHRNMY